MASISLGPRILRRPSAPLSPNGRSLGNTLGGATGFNFSGVGNNVSSIANQLANSNAGAQAVSPAAGRLGQLSNAGLSSDVRSGLSAGQLDPAVLANLQAMNRTGGLVNTDPLKQAAQQQGAQAFSGFKDDILSTLAATGGLDSSASINALLRAGSDVASNIGIQGLQADFAAQSDAAGRRLGALTPGVAAGDLSRKAFADLGNLEAAFNRNNIAAAQGQGNLQLGGAGLDQAARLGAGNLDLGLINAFAGALPGDLAGGGSGVGGGLSVGGGSPRRGGGGGRPPVFRQDGTIAQFGSGRFSGVTTPAGGPGPQRFARGGTVGDFNDFLRMVGAEASKGLPTSVPFSPEMLRDFAINQFGGEGTAREVFETEGGLAALANKGKEFLGNAATRFGVGVRGPANSVQAALLGLGRVNAEQPTSNPGVIRVGAEDAIRLGLDPSLNFSQATEELPTMALSEGGAPGGTDIVPAMLTPGEGVVPVENMAELMTASTPNEQIKVARDLQQIMATRDGDPIEGGTGFADGGLASSPLMELLIRLGLQQREDTSGVIPLDIQRDPETFGVIPSPVAPTPETIQGGFATSTPRLPTVPPTTEGPVAPPVAEPTGRKTHEEVMQEIRDAVIRNSVASESELASESIAPLAVAGGAEPNHLDQIKQFQRENELAMFGAKATRDNLATALMQMNAFHPQRDAMLQQFIIAQNEVDELGGDRLASQELFLKGVEVEMQDERLKAEQAERIRQQEIVNQQNAERIAQGEEQLDIQSRDVSTREQAGERQERDPRRTAALILLNPDASVEQKEQALTIVTGGRNLNDLPPETEAMLKVMLSNATPSGKLEALRALGFTGASGGGLLGGTVVPGEFRGGGENIDERIAQAFLQSIDE